MSTLTAPRTLSAAEEDVIAQMEAQWQHSHEQKLERKRRRRQPAVIRLWDGNWTLRGRCTVARSGSFRWKLNDTGAGRLVIPLRHYLAQWAIDVWGRPTQNIHITVDKDGARWGGRLRRGKIVKSADGKRDVELEFLHDYEELKRIQVWSNPFLPPEVQFPKVFILAGPARYMCKLALWLNLVRLQGSWSALPNNPLDPANWTGGLDPSQWPIAVKPHPVLQDGSVTTFLSSRFKYWHDMATPSLEDGHLMVECRRYLDGDPEPWPGYRPRHGQLVVDILDKSGYWDDDGAGTEGTLLGGIVRTALQLADNFVDETRTLIADPVEPPEYSMSILVGTVPSQPWVVYRDDVHGVSTSEFTWEPSQASIVTAGGHSMPGTNELIGAAIQVAGDLASSTFVGPNVNAGQLLDTALKPLYSDALLAWMSVESPVRAMHSGWSHYYEYAVSGADQAYTLSGLLALRKGFWETRARTGHSIKVLDGHPYYIGEHGHGHFFLGDRIASTLAGLPDGRLIVEQCSELEYAFDRGGGSWDITVGDPRSNESGWEKNLRVLKNVTTAIHDLGVL